MVLPWRSEEAELLWARGQRGMATQLAAALLGHASQLSNGAAAEQLATLQSTLGRWLAENRRAQVPKHSSIARAFGLSRVCPSEEREAAWHRDKRGMRKSVCTHLTHAGCLHVDCGTIWQWEVNASCLLWRRAERSAVVLETMQAALDRVSGGQDAACSEVACDAAFTLAQYADAMYRWGRVADCVLLHGMSAEICSVPWQLPHAWTALGM